jgi:hypothetical protein
MVIMKNNHKITYGGLEPMNITINTRFGLSFGLSFDLG